ncbi:MAG: hypothetical protein GX126_13040 [Bacteroidales bacterium]|nr:hypothetical protein [Bacteroidales bacterium]
MLDLIFCSCPGFQKVSFRCKFFILYKSG